MAKVLKKGYEFPTGTRINYQESWFTGDTIELDETDLGPGNPASKAQSIKRHAKDNYGKGVRTAVPENDPTKLVIQAYDLPTEK